MEYPVTIEQLKQAFKETCGEEMSDDQNKFWKDFADVLNGAYDAGVIAGIRKAHEAVCKA